MGGLLDDIAGSLADDLIADFGTTAQIITTTGGSYDPVTGAATAGAETATTINVAPPAAYNVREIDGTSIRQGDMRLTIPRLQLAQIPAPGAIIQIGGIRYQVVDCNPVYSGAQAAAWEVQIRK